MRIGGNQGLGSQSSPGLKDVIWQTLHSPVSISQETIDTVGKGTGLKVLRKHLVRQTMVPVCQKDRGRIAFGL